MSFRSDLRRDRQAHRPLALGPDARSRGARGRVPAGGPVRRGQRLHQALRRVAGRADPAGSGVAVGTTIGFPHGGHATAVKVFEAEQAMADGATELDMVDQHRPGDRRRVGRGRVRYRRRDQSRS